MQRNCIFPGRYAPLTYYDWLRGRPRNTLMARNARECDVYALICHVGVTTDRQKKEQAYGGGCSIARRKVRYGRLLLLDLAKSRRKPSVGKSLG